MVVSFEYYHLSAVAAGTTWLLLLKYFEQYDWYRHRAHFDYCSIYSNQSCDRHLNEPYISVVRLRCDNCRLCGFHSMVPLSNELRDVASS